MKIRRRLFNTLALSLGAALAAFAGAAPLRANADAPAGPAPSTFTFRNADGGDIFVYRWLPTTEEKASVLIVHGLAEHAGVPEPEVPAISHSAKPDEGPERAAN